ncbi:hypothetical protein BC832DRAFT_592956 [Gaertneriomyces semiglobifer]|nr:hypothetical protein BC832DRAFT_592956 [Gaertneriomyces semiglobifer]
MTTPQKTTDARCLDFLVISASELCMLSPAREFKAWYTTMLDTHKDLIDYSIHFLARWPEMQAGVLCDPDTSRLTRQFIYLWETWFYRQGGYGPPIDRPALLEKAILKGYRDIATFLVGQGQRLIHPVLVKDPLESMSSEYIATLIVAGVGFRGYAGLFVRSIN